MCHFCGVVFAGTFQSALPRRERLLSRFPFHVSRDFNPRSREGSDGRDGHCSLPYCEFQSALPRRERLYWDIDKIKIPQFQSALPRRERLACYRLKAKNRVISIRAPAKGATNINKSYSHSSKISIRAPAKGATTIDLPSHRAIIFQSALPRRERRAEYVHTGYRGAISIRAPAKGATSAENGGKHFIRISIRAPAKGATTSSALKHTVHLFQSALPRRERLNLIS